jgi:hypothetical protein
VGKYATALTIKTYGPVTGAQHGIFASFGETDSNEPTGALSITAGGSVTGLTGSGVYAVNFWSNGLLDVDHRDEDGLRPGQGRRRHRLFAL